jgi:hypothetical protein
MIETRTFQQLWNKRLRLEIWYSCVVASALIAVGQLAAFQVDRHILGKPFFGLRLPYLFVAVACLIVLLHQRDELGFKAIQRTMVVLTLAGFPYIWLSQAAYANSKNPWIPFYGFQIAALAMAMLRYGNGIRFNVFLLAAIAIEATAFWWRFHFWSEPLLAHPVIYGMLCSRGSVLWHYSLLGICMNGRLENTLSLKHVLPRRR